MASPGLHFPASFECEELDFGTHGFSHANAEIEFICEHVVRHNEETIT